MWFQICTVRNNTIKTTSKCTLKLAYKVLEIIGPDYVGIYLFAKCIETYYVGDEETVKGFKDGKLAPVLEHKFDAA